MLHIINKDRVWCNRNCQIGVSDLALLGNDILLVIILTSLRHQTTPTLSQGLDAVDVGKTNLILQ